MPDIQQVLSKSWLSISWPGLSPSTRMYLFFWACLRPVLSSKVEFTALTPSNTYTHNTQHTHTHTHCLGLLCLFNSANHSSLSMGYTSVGLPLPSESSPGGRRLLEPFPSLSDWPRFHHNVSNHEAYLHESWRPVVDRDQAFSWP